MPHRSSKWMPAFLHAVPISLFILGLFYYWFAVADRYVIFLYNHLDATPFDRLTSARYWMSGLVASGAVMVLYAIANWFLGRLAGLRYRVYTPPKWRQTWLLCVIPLIVGILAITMTRNQPRLPLSNAVSCVAATLAGLALALMPGSLAAQRPSELGWLALYGMGLVPGLLFLRAVELPERGLVSAPGAFVFAVGGVCAGAVWLAILTWLRVSRQKSWVGPGELLAAGLGLSYVLMPLAHHVLFVPPDYRYISTSSNFFAFNPGVQLVSFVVTAALAVGVARLQRRLQKKEEETGE